MKTKPLPFLMFVVGLVLIGMIVLRCYRSTEATAAEPAPTLEKEEPPRNTVDPLDPYKDNMQVLTLQDARGCPRVYIRMHRGETFWMDKNGRVFERCKKTGRLVQSL